MGLRLTDTHDLLPSGAGCGMSGVEGGTTAGAGQRDGVSSESGAVVDGPGVPAGTGQPGEKGTQASTKGKRGTTPPPHPLDTERRWAIIPCPVGTIPLLPIAHQTDHGAGHLVNGLGKDVAHGGMLNQMDGFAVQVGPGPGLVRPSWRDDRRKRRIRGGGTQSRHEYGPHPKGVQDDMMATASPVCSGMVWPHTPKG